MPMPEIDVIQPLHSEETQLEILSKQGLVKQGGHE